MQHGHGGGKVMAQDGTSVVTSGRRGSSGDETRSMRGMLSAWHKCAMRTIGRGDKVTQALETWIDGGQWR